MKKKCAINAGEQIVASLHVLSDTKKAGKLTNRTGLSPEELRQPMRVIKTTDSQIQVRHPKLDKPFIVHSKYFEHAPAAPQ